MSELPSREQAAKAIKRYRSPALDPIAPASVLGTFAAVTAAYAEGLIDRLSSIPPSGSESVMTELSSYKRNKMRRIPIQLPPSVHEEVKRDAARLHISVPELIRIALGRLDVDDLAATFAAAMRGKTE